MMNTRFGKAGDFMHTISEITGDEEMCIRDRVNVPGNCDFSRGDTERLIDIDGYKVLMCHGHTLSLIHI